MSLYTIKLEEAKLHISKGNSKIGKGIWSFSTLPGNSEHLIYINGKILLTDIPGTCSKYCNGCAKDGACYAWRDAKLHHNVTIRAWGENTLLLRHDPDKLFSMIDEFITTKNKKKIQVNTWRWNVSGEIESLKQLELMNDLAAKHPEVAFGIYTKNYDVLEEFIKIQIILQLALAMQQTKVTSIPSKIHLSQILKTKIDAYKTATCPEPCKGCRWRTSACHDFNGDLCRHVSDWLNKDFPSKSKFS